MTKKVLSISFATLFLTGSLSLGQIAPQQVTRQISHTGPQPIRALISAKGAQGLRLRLRGAADIKSRMPVAKLSEHISIKLDQDGDRLVNFSGGRELVPAFQGPAELVTALQSNSARPASLASADVDGDGVADLVCGYSLGDRGIIAIYRGNQDVMYSTRSVSGEVTDESPFAGEARVIAAPSPVDFVGIGDFDGDGVPDLIAATLGREQLHFFAGTGSGEFASPSEFDLPGVVTAIQTADLNRRDGLADIAVAVTGNDGPRLLIYEGPNGALKSKPETIPLPGQANSIAVGQLDDDYWNDIAVGAGRKLVIVHGRDRRLTLDKIRQEEAVLLSKDSISVPFEIASVATGDFAGKGRTAMALLGTDGSVHIMERTTKNGKDRWAENQSEGAFGESLHASGMLRGRVAGSDGDNLVILNDSAKQMQVFSLDGPSPRERSLEIDSEPVAALAMRLNGDGIKDLVVLRKGHSAPALLRTQASSTFTVTGTADGGNGSLRQEIANANSAGGTALIQFSIGGGVPVISPGSPLPAVNVPMTIDGTTANARFVVLDGNGAGSSTDGLDLNRSNSLVNGVDMHNFHGFVDSSNILHGGYGIALFGGHSTVENCFLGSNGGSATPNASGLEVVSGNNLIGGTASGTGNLISGNQYSGLIQGGNGVDNNAIVGNEIGTTANGQGALRNGGSGLNIIDSQNNTIANNLISGNGNNGISITSVSRVSGQNLIGGNYIGTDGTGSRAIGNQSAGVFLLSSSFNNIGSTDPNARNIISGNGNQGVALGADASANNNLIQNNFIGTNVNGNAPVGNGFIGVFIAGSQNTLGGLAQGSGNVVTGTTEVNGVSGDVGIEGGGGSSPTGGNQVQGNFIGTDISGSFAVGSAQFGLLVDQSPNNTVGGPQIGAGNLVSGHSLDGVDVARAASMGNLVQGNFVGTDRTGHSCIPNQRFGIVVTVAPNNTVTQNLLSCNGLAGVAIGALFQGLFGDSSTLLSQNFIGTDQTGLAALPNSGSGVFVENDSVNNRIDSNTIAFNQGAGIRIPDDPSDPTITRSPAIQIHLTNNLIFSNTGLGIDLGPTGPTANPFNQQTGANLHQNFPNINSAAFTATSTGGIIPATTPSITVAGTMQAKANTTYSMQFYFGGNCDGGQGHEFLGQIPIFLGNGQVTTDGNGNGPYSFSFPLSGTSITTSGFVNATATDPQGNTSEFSLCAAVTGTAPVIPQITGVTIQGKNVIVTGTNFDSKAVVELDGTAQKTKHDASNPNSLIGKKVAKKLVTGTQVMFQVKNSNGLESAPFPFTP